MTYLLLTATVITLLITVAVLIFIDQRYLKPRWDYHRELQALINTQTQHQEGH